MTDNPSDPDAPAQGARRKVRPPVIELDATDVTPKEEKRESAESVEGVAEAPKQAEPQAKMQSPSPEKFGRDAFRLIAIAGFVGALVGALAVALVFIFAGDGLARLIPSSNANVAGAASPDSRVERLAKVAGDLEKRVAAVESRPSPQIGDLTPLTSRTESIETAVSNLRRLIDQTQAAHTASTEVVAGKISALENRLTQPVRTAVANAAEIASLGALQDAIVKGTSFSKELAAARKILGERAASLAPLEKFAESGLPTVAALNARFSELAPKLAREPETNAGYFSRLIAHAGRLVEVRPVGEVQGPTAGAVVARIEARLARGDLNAAVEETSKLPPAAKADAADWIATATDRRDAEANVRNLLGTALANSASEQPK